MFHGSQGLSRRFRCRRQDVAISANGSSLARLAQAKVMAVGEVVALKEWLTGHSNFPFGVDQTMQNLW